MARDDIRRYSRDELEQIVAKGDYVATRPDAPEIDLGDEFWRTAQLVMPSPEPKKHTGIRIDADVLAWFKAQGRGWQTRMNAVLRAYYEAQKHG